MSSKEAPAPKVGRLVVYGTFRMTKKRRKVLQSVEEFEKELREEISVSIEFDLPLTVVLDLNIRGISGGGDLRVMRRAIGVLCTADLVARPSPEELLVALPNTTPDDARVAEERLHEVVPEASSSVTTCREGDTVGDLLQRAYAAR